MPRRGQGGALGPGDGHPEVPRDGIIEAIRVLQVVYRSAVRDRTAATNQFHSVVVSAPADVRHDLQQMPHKQCFERDRDGDGIAARAARQALRELALRIELRDGQAGRLEVELRRLRTQAGLHQLLDAAQFDIPVQRLSRIERGITRDPNMQTPIHARLTASEIAQIAVWHP